MVYYTPEAYSNYQGPYIKLNPHNAPKAPILREPLVAPWDPWCNCLFLLVTIGAVIIRIGFWRFRSIFVIIVYYNPKPYSNH